MKDHVSLQERLKDLRVEKGLKLEELAEKTVLPDRKPGADKYPAVRTAFDR